MMKVLLGELLSYAKLGVLLPYCTKRAALGLKIYGQDVFNGYP